MRLRFTWSSTELRTCWGSAVSTVTGRPAPHRPPYGIKDYLLYDLDLLHLCDALACGV